MLQSSEDTFKEPQYADDWGFLKPYKFLPSNVDGLAHHITERRGRFLFLEVKRGEAISPGQQYMLEALARVPEFDVWVVHSYYRDPNVTKHSRVVEPHSIQRYDRTGKLGDPESCDVEQFRLRYVQWFRSQSVPQDKEVP